MTKYALKIVSFAPGNRLETVHLVENYNSTEPESNTEDMATVLSSSRLSEEITLLSTSHGRSRRYLREIKKVTLQDAVKYGIKTKGRADPKTGLPRWKYSFANVVFITDNSSSCEVTCYKEAVTIEPAPISQAMVDRHIEVKQILNAEPQLCTSHTVVIMDQSGSMRTADVNGFRNRSEAAYGSLALDYVAERLCQQGDPAGVDTLTLIEMNDVGTMVYEREPLDWILFNKLLERQAEAKPRSHGSYLDALRLAAESIVNERALLGDEIEHEDLPNFALVFLSDGKPSDVDVDSETERLKIVKALSLFLKEKLTVFCMALGASGSDFLQLKKLSSVATKFGASGEFNHAGLCAANLGRGFSAISSTMSSLRDGLLSSTLGNAEEKDDREVVALKNRQSLAKSRSDCRRFVNGIYRYIFNQKKWEQFEYAWQHSKIRDGVVGFELDKIPFGRGAERLAFRFQEVDKFGNLVGKMMVAKESKLVRDEGKKLRFHEDFCRTQVKAGELARLFNRAVRKNPLLKPSKTDRQRIPDISFLRCHVYVFEDDNGNEAGLLVENYLNGKWAKFIGNDSTEKKHHIKERDIKVQAGTIMLIDILHAFSHWTYVHTDHKILVCDLQGVLNDEGMYPEFQLTDPAICSTRQKKQYKFGKTDLGWGGMRSFSQHHKCNLMCKCLGLAPIGTR